MGEPRSLNQLTKQHVVDSNDLDEELEAMLQRFNGDIADCKQRAHQFIEALGQYVDKVFIAPIGGPRSNGLVAFIENAEPESRILVTQWHEVLIPAVVQQTIELARKRRILLVTLEHKALLLLPIDDALALQAQLSKQGSSRRFMLVDVDEEDYDKLRQLMAQGRTVDDIVATTGWSRSTVFRLRKRFEDRLRKDVYGFERRQIGITKPKHFDTNTD
jgi:hypothetical protein